MAAYPSNEAIARSIPLIEELTNQSDRGVAIVGVAWIEEALVAAIKSYVDSCPVAWDRLFRKSGPMSSLSAKIDLARLLAMTDDAIHSDLHILREIRNEFAHAVLDKNNAVLSFGTNRIRDKCMAIKCVMHES